jgi:hypothetical protein
MAHRTSITPLLAILLICACDIKNPPFTNEDADLYYHGAWELTSIAETVEPEGMETTERPPTADEARTWHVFPSEEYEEDSLRSSVTVEWGGRTGSGYWYFEGSGVRVDVSLSTQNGGSETFLQTFGASGGDGATLQLSYSDPYFNVETYRRVGPP